MPENNRKMLGKPDIERLGHVARILSLPLSEASKKILLNTFSEIIYLDRTKNRAQLVHAEDVFYLDAKLRAFVIIPSDLIDVRFLQYIINSAPINKKIEEARANRSLSTPVLDDIPIPLEPKEKQIEIAKIGAYIDRLTMMSSKGDMDASLGSYFLIQVALAINTELFFPFLCSINNIHIYEQWLMFSRSLPEDTSVIANEIIKPGNRLMVEVRSLQRVMANAQKSIQDGLQD